jgi:hypothetical protein
VSRSVGQVKSSTHFLSYTLSLPLTSLLLPNFLQLAIITYASTSIRAADHWSGSPSPSSTLNLLRLLNLRPLQAPLWRTLAAARWA